MKTYACDFDKTFTSDPDLFRDIVKLMRARGHKVIMVTQRCVKYQADIEAVVGDLTIFDAVIFASGHSKEKAAAGFGWFPDVWMDDAPYSVYTALTFRGC